VTTVDDEADAAALASQAFDLAVQVRSLRDSTLVARRLAAVTFSLCAAPAYLVARGRPRSPADLRQHECIRRLGVSPETTWDLVHKRSGRRVRAPIGGRFECSDARLQSELLAAGFGIGLRPAAEVRRAVDRGSMEAVLPAYTLAPIPVWIVAPRGRLTVPRVAHVAAVVAQVVAGLA
jgi:DNA-binding transcriptional LysR family regulator